MEAARPARIDDLPVVAALVEQARTEASEGRGGPLFLAREAWWPSSMERLERAVEDRHAQLVVGCYDDLVFGYGLATVEELGDGSRIGVVQDLVVEPAMRKVGIGEAMMNLLIEELQAAGCVGVDSWALPGDRHTKNFFESFGLKARLLIVHRSFADADGDTEA